MNKTNRTRRRRNRLVYTVITAFLLLSMFFFIVNYSYDLAKQNGFERLHLQTKEVKDDIELQMISDRENLQTMASFAAKLYSNGEKMDIILNSFKSIGLTEEVGIFLPDNTLSTRTGKINVTEFSFEDEAKKVPYVSGVVSDVSAPEKSIVRSAVPVLVEGKTVGILYGAISLDALEKRLMDNVTVEGTQIFVVERGTGSFIVNTVSKDVGNFSRLNSRKFVDEYTYEDFKNKALGGLSGYTAFVSQIMKDTTLYMHYAPLTIGDWQIMLAETESSVFEEASATGNAMALIFSAIVLVMSVYLVLMVMGESKDGRMNMCASGIRKTLLGINQHETGISNALKKVAVFSLARSAFFVSSEGDDYNYIVPNAEKVKLKDEDVAYFVSRILNLLKREFDENGVTVKSMKLSPDSRLYESDRELHDFLDKFGINNVVFVGIANKKNNISVLGCVNPKRIVNSLLLLEDVAVCFSMAIHNKKYLNKTEIVATTDSLTGLYNRMAYKTDTFSFNEKQLRDFSCVYVDVNELHVTNNKYGHATGDGMLIYIANAMKEIFNTSHIYRIGGDEFLAFTEDTAREEIEKKTELLIAKVEAANYHISVGMDFCSINKDTEELVSCAEKRMYEEKARYYQQKERNLTQKTMDNNVESITTGIREFDALLSILSTRYHGVYCVSLDTGMARRILMPAYLSKFSEDETAFKDAFLYYVREMVHPDHQRALTSFINYDVIKKELAENIIPSISYVKATGEKVLLSVYGLKGTNGESSETLWIFENID